MITDKNNNHWIKWRKINKSNKVKIWYNTSRSNLTMSVCSLSFIHYAQYLYPNVMYHFVIHQHNLPLPINISFIWLTSILLSPSMFMLSYSYSFPSESTIINAASNKYTFINSLTNLLSLPNYKTNHSFYSDINHILSSSFSILSVINLNVW